jgi:hypothetical protein
MGWRSVVIRPFADPNANIPAEITEYLLTAESVPLGSGLNAFDLRASLGPLLDREECPYLVFLIDQVEDILLSTDNEGRKSLCAFLRELWRASHLRPGLKALVTYRLDADARLGPVWQEVTDDPKGLPYHTLAGLTREDAEQLITSVAARSGWTLDVSPRELAQQLVAVSTELGGAGEVYPPYLQILLLDADSAPNKIVGPEFLSSLGGVEGLVTRFLNTSLEDLEARGGEWINTRRILECLSRSSGEKITQSLEEVSSYTQLPLNTVQLLLAELTRRRLVRPLGGVTTKFNMIV